MGGAPGHFFAEGEDGLLHQRQGDLRSGDGRALSVGDAHGEAGLLAGRVIGPVRRDGNGQLPVGSGDGKFHAGRVETAVGEREVGSFPAKRGVLRLPDVHGDENVGDIVGLDGDVHHREGRGQVDHLGPAGGPALKGEQGRPADGRFYEQAGDVARRVLGPVRQNAQTGGRFSPPGLAEDGQPGGCRHLMPQTVGGDGAEFVPARLFGGDWYAGRAVASGGDSDGLDNVGVPPRFRTVADQFQADGAAGDHLVKNRPRGNPNGEGLARRVQVTACVQAQTFGSGIDLHDGEVAHGLVAPVVHRRLHAPEGAGPAPPPGVLIVAGGQGEGEAAAGVGGGLNRGGFGRVPDVFLFGGTGFLPAVPLPQAVHPDLYRRMGHRFAEEILALHRHRDGLVGDIAMALGEHLDLIVGLAVVLDLEDLPVGLAVHNHFHDVVAQHRPVGQGEFAVDGAEGAGGQGEGLDDVIPRVPDADGDGGPDGRQGEDGVVVPAQDALEEDGLAGAGNGAVGVDVGGGAGGRGGGGGAPPPPPPPLLRLHLHRPPH